MGLPDFEHCPTCQGTGRIAQKPIKRSIKRIKHHVDHAEFDPFVIAKIWPDGKCPLTGLRNSPPTGVYVDRMHILGRGGGEKIFSSPFNCCLGFRGFHASAYRDTPEARALLLKIAKRQVDQAVMRGLYEPTDNDAEFLSYAHQKLLSYMNG